MRILLIEHDKSESIREITSHGETDYPSLRAVENCFKTVDGERLPIYVPLMAEAATSHLCTYIFKKYGRK